MPELEVNPKRLEDGETKTFSQYFLNMTDACRMPRRDPSGAQLGWVFAGKHTYTHLWLQRMSCHCPRP